MRAYRAAILASAAAALTLACGSLRSPDVDRIYAHAAEHRGPERRPLIVIPGTLGSKLVQEGSDRVAWGTFFGAGARPQSPRGARLIALPMALGAELADLRDDVVADGALDRFEVAGLELQVEAYAGLLEAIAAGGYLDAPATCFQFDYDFRRDNVENARRLHEFILDKRARVLEDRRRRFGTTGGEVKFDVVTHSMGGLILRYYLRYGGADLPADGSAPAVTWAGARHVARAVLISPPNAGGAEALSYLADGRRFGFIGPRYAAAVLSTHPSMFQLLPRVRHGAVVDEASGRPIDFMDPQVWEDHGWGLADPAEDGVLEALLPGVAGAGERRRIALDHLRKSLRRARRFHAALDLPAQPPPGTELHLITGDAVDTPEVLSVGPGGELRVRTRGPGDGRVLRSSALMDERQGRAWQPAVRSPIDWTQATFLPRDHLDITHDPVFVDNLLYRLLEAPAVRRAGAAGQR